MPCILRVSARPLRRAVQLALGATRTGIAGSQADAVPNSAALPEAHHSSLPPLRSRPSRRSSTSRSSCHRRNNWHPRHRRSVCSATTCRGVTRRPASTTRGEPDKADYRARSLRTQPIRRNSPCRTSCWREFHPLDRCLTAGPEEVSPPATAATRPRCGDKFYNGYAISAGRRAHPDPTRPAMALTGGSGGLPATCQMHTVHTDCARR